MRRASCRPEKRCTAGCCVTIHVPMLRPTALEPRLHRRKAAVKRVIVQPERMQHPIALLDWCRWIHLGGERSGLLHEAGVPAGITSSRRSDGLELLIVR